MGLEENIGAMLRTAFGADDTTLPEAFIDLLNRLTVSTTGDARAPSGLSDAQFKAELTQVIPRLRAFARSLARDETLADDLVQDTMMRAWNARDRFQQGTSFKSWTFTILRNSFLSSLRRKKFTAEWNEETMADKFTAAADQDRHINIADVQRALYKLPEVQRHALILVGAEQMTYEEAAEVCAVPLGTIKSRVNRGRATLARLMDGDTDEDVAA